MEQSKYDVFISYSRKDYVVNDRIIPDNPITAIQKLFDKNDVKYWFDKDGIYSGEEFVKEISTAIVNSKMLVFVSSKNSNESEYTCGEILKAKKAKKLIIPFRIDECEYNEKFEILLLPLNHIDYVNQPNTAISELLRTVNKEKERIRQLERDKNENLLKEQKKKEIIDGIKEFQRLNGEQDFLLRSLYSKSKDLGTKTKQCPVCDTEMFVDASYCESCGWSFASLYGIYGVDGKSLHEEKQLQIVRGLWNDIKEVKKTRIELEKTIKLYNDAKKNTLELEQRFKLVEQQYLELKLRKEEAELRQAEEKRQAEENRRREETEERKRKEYLKAEEERKRREEEEWTKERTFNVGSVSFKMIRVEGGSFLMGSPDNDSDAFDNEKPQHRVTLTDYYIAETQVTQALWKAVMGNNPSSWKGDNLPVERVSWKDCQEFIKQLNKKTGKTFRLPTEAEWEYAARGGRKSQGFKYSGDNEIDKVAWHDLNSGSKTHAVKQKSANELGLHDMSGNVWEWCQDWEKDYAGSAQTNPSGPSSGFCRILRGGCWSSYSKKCRVSSRYYDSPSSKFMTIGFRLALVASSSSAFTPMYS